MKYTERFSRLCPGAGTVLAMIASFYFLAEGVKSIPVGAGYAAWTGIGAAGTALWGIVLFGEATAVPRLTSSLALIVTGIVGMKTSS